jgi:putative transposase
MEVHPKQHPEFITVTCLEWKPLLEDDKHKQVIIDSLQFLVKE